MHHFWRVIQHHPVCLKTYKTYRPNYSPHIFWVPSLLLSPIEIMIHRTDHFQRLNYSLLLTDYNPLFSPYSTQKNQGTPRSMVTKRISDKSRTQNYYLGLFRVLLDNHCQDLLKAQLQFFHLSQNKILE